MIIQTVNFHTFRQAFIDMGRGDQFSYDGLAALYDHLMSLSEDTGEPVELDVIGLCCEYSEESYKDIDSQYDLATPEELSELDDDEQMELIVERLENETVIVYEGTDKVLFQAF